MHSDNVRCVLKHRHSGSRDLFVFLHEKKHFEELHHKGRIAQVLTPRYRHEDYNIELIFEMTVVRS